MIHVEPVRAEHMIALHDVQPKMGITIDRAFQFEEMGGNYAVFDDDRLLCVGGLVERHPGCGYAWSILTEQWKKYVLPISRLVRQRLNEADFHRIEATVEHGFVEGQRWMRTLGFQLECPRMRKWSPEGDDYALYARVK